MAKRRTNHRKIIVHPPIDLMDARRALFAYKEEMEKQWPDYLEKLKDRSGELNVWKEENSMHIQIQNSPAKYVSVYATPSQYVIYPIPLQNPVVKAAWDE